MSYQKTKWKFARPSLSKGVRGCNKPSSETRAEKLARKEATRAGFHAAAQDYDRITAIMAGTRWTQERTLGGVPFAGDAAPIRVVESRKVDRHNSLPHEGEREVARRLRKAA